MVVVVSKALLILACGCSESGVGVVEWCDVLCRNSFAQAERVAAPYDGQLLSLNDVAAE